MALATGTLFEVMSTATTGNTGGAGFNPANAAFPTDLTTDANTANTASPIVSSATYAFVAGDVGAYLYVKSGTNSIPGFWPIASVAGGKATLSAAIGAGEILDANTGFYKASTAVGIATVGTPTNLTFGVDYSRLATAMSTITDAASVGSSTTLTSVTAPWTPVSVGNFFHLTAAGTGGFGVVGWYEIATYVAAGQVTTDRTTNSGTAMVAGTGQTGGAGRFNGLEDAFYEMIPAGSMIYVKGSGTHTFSASLSIASTNSTAAAPSWTIGYTSVRGDDPTGTNRPTFAYGANTVGFGVYQSFQNIICTITAANGMSLSTGGVAKNCAHKNTSTTAARIALTSTLTINCEAVSQNGVGVAAGQAGKLIGNYIHDCATGINSTGTGLTIIENLLEANVTAAMTINSATGNSLIAKNTIYGREAKMGIGINLTNATSINYTILNNNIYGNTTGIAVTTTQQNSTMGAFNNFFNNTTDVSLYYKDKTDLAVDPTFTSAVQITGTTATTSGSVLTQSGGDFSTVSDNIDYLHVISGTGVTTGGYLITSHTSTTLTVNNALGTSSGGDVVYFVGTGHNFAVGTNLKATGFPGLFNGSETTGYSDIGAVQRQEAGGGSFTFAG